MALNTNHINTILKANPYTRRHFIGTFPCCAIEILPKKKIYSFITNVDHHSDSGTHWNAWVVKDKTVFFFDSFGRSPFHPSFPHDYQDILLKFKSFKYFKRQIQSINSFTCGYFCIHFVLNFSLGLDIGSFSSDYKNDTNKNDIVVMKIIQSIV